MSSSKLQTRLVIQCCLACALLLLPFAAARADEISTAAPPVAPKRLTIPSAAAEAAARKLVRDSFKAEYANTKPAARGELIAALMEAAATETSPAQRYALLREVIDIAAAAGSVSPIRRAAEKLTAEFNVSFPAIVFPAYTAAAKVIRDPAGSRALAEAALELTYITSAGETADFAGAAKAAGIAEAAAKTSRDAALIDRCKARSKETAEQQRQYARISAIEKKLAASPDDGEMNLEVGQFYCFAVGAWSRGLPLLAKGSDASLKTIAGLELKVPRDDAERVALADAWWDYADHSKTRGDKKSETGSRRRAAEWYTRAEAGLTGLAKAKVKGRLAFLAAANVDQRSPKRINLLELVRPSNDEKGKWEKRQRDGAVTVDADKFCQMQFSYEPPAEYDIEAEFTLLKVNSTEFRDGIVLMILPVPGKPGQSFHWYMATDLIGFHSLQGALDPQRPALLLSNLLQVNQKLTATVKVRRNGLQGFMNGKLFVEMSAERAARLVSMTPWELPDRNAIGLGGHAISAVFHRVEIVEKSGPGKVLRE